METYYGITIFEWIFLCVVIFLGVWYLIIQTTYPRVKCVPKTALKESLLTNGDLLFLCGNTRGERTCKWFTSSEYSHVAMVFEENGIWYTIDCDIGGKHHKDGVRITTLKTKLSRKGLGDTIGLRKYTGILPITSDKIMGIYEKYKDIDFDNTMGSWFTSRVGWLHGYFKDPKKMFCSEFMGVLLRELGLITDATFPPSDYSPSSFYNNTLHIPYGMMECFKKL